MLGAIYCNMRNSSAQKCHRLKYIKLLASKNTLLLHLSILFAGAIATNTTDDSTLLERDYLQRHGKFFPFYTLGRFQNTPCVGSNQLMGTCVLAGECTTAGGVATGSCNAITRQAVCCVYQQTCGGSTSSNNTYFVSPNYPAPWPGGSSCSLTVNPCSASVCQLRVSFSDMSLAPPDGDGICDTDIISISGGASQVPNLCGENAGQHVIVQFDGTNPITITVTASSSYTYGRHWFIRTTQYNCGDPNSAPSGCLQYHLTSSGVIRSFNYDPSPNGQLNSIGVEGSRQIASLSYGICVQAISSCSITYRVLSSDANSFTMTGDVGAVDPDLLGDGTLQDQTCNTDYIIIPDPTQNGDPLPGDSDRFCGLGLNPTTSNVLPYVVYAITDEDEELDIGNRGFALAYTQNECPVI